MTKRSDNSTPPQGKSAPQRNSDAKERVRERFRFAAYLRQQYPHAKFIPDGSGYMKVTGESLGHLSFNDETHHFTWDSAGLSGDCFNLVGHIEHILTFPEQLQRCADIAGVFLEHELAPMDHAKRGPAPAPESTWTYYDRAGTPVYQVCRGVDELGKKTYWQRRADGSGGWINGMKGVDRQLYNLEAVIEAAAQGKRVFIVEGEKCADALNKLGYTATTITGGAKASIAWEDRYSEDLADAHVVILPDNDDVGRAFAEQIAGHAHKVAASVRIVPLYPYGNDKRDIADWLEEGGTEEALERMVRETGAWDPDARTQSPAPSIVTLEDIGGLVGSVSWLWPGWIPHAMLSMLTSEPEKGKSYVSLRLAQSITQGVPWPDGTPYTGELGRVLWLESEGGLALHLERMRKMHMPASGIILPFGNDSADPWAPMVEFNLMDRSHMEQLRARAVLEDVRLIILDSLSGAAQGMSENSADMLAAMRGLLSIARETGLPILILHHFRKANGGEGDAVTLDRVRGSSAITQLPRTIMAIDAPNEAQPEARRLSLVKNNLAPKAPPLGFTLHDSGPVFTREAPRRVRTDTAVDRAREFLYARLEHGTAPSTEIEADATEAGISSYSLREAKKALGVIVKKGSDSRAAGWTWSLPSKREEPF